jgi:hypothetical protein
MNGAPTLEAMTTEIRGGVPPEGACMMEWIAYLNVIVPHAGDEQRLGRLISSVAAETTFVEYAP